MNERNCVWIGLMLLSLLAIASCNKSPTDSDGTPRRDIQQGMDTNTWGNAQQPGTAPSAAAPMPTMTLQPRGE